MTPIRRLGGLDRDVVQMIVAQIDPLHSVTELRAAIRAATGVDDDVARQDAAAIMASAQVRQVRRESAAIFAERLSEDPDLDIPEQERESFTWVITQLLDARGVKALARAADVSTEHEHVYLDARILTDLRPVFSVEFEDDESDAEPEGLVVVHTLKLGFQQDGEYHQIYLAMDDLDLSSLSETLRRAERKAQGLKAMMNNRDIIHYTLGGD